MKDAGLQIFTQELMWEKIGFLWIYKQRLNLV